MSEEKRYKRIDGCQIQVTIRPDNQIVIGDGGYDIDLYEEDEVKHSNEDIRKLIAYVIDLAYHKGKSDEQERIMRNLVQEFKPNANP
jgi:hypothetical protein